MILSRFKNLYQELNHTNLELLDDVYDRQICFVDPFHQVTGLDNLKKYFRELYANVDAIEFEFGEAVSDGGRHSIQWTMSLNHPRLNRGKNFQVPGVTLLTVNENQKITYHRDYFDGGIMLYEQLPLIGKIVKLIKRKI